MDTVSKKDFLKDADKYFEKAKRKPLVISRGKFHYTLSRDGQEEVEKKNYLKTRVLSMLNKFNEMISSIENEELKKKLKKSLDDEVPALFDDL